MKLKVFLFCVFMVLVYTTVSAQQYYALPYPRIPIEIGMKGVFSKNLMLFKQENKTTISGVGDLGLASGTVIGDLFVNLYLPRLEFGYSYTLPLTYSGTGKLPTSIILNGTELGKSEKDGKSDPNKTINTEIKAGAHEWEISFPAILDRRSPLYPFIMFESSNVYVSMKENGITNGGAFASNNYNRFIMGAGAKLNYNFAPNYAMRGKMAGTFLDNSSGFLFDIQMIFQRALALGYMYRSRSFRFDGGSVDLAINGPYLELKYVF